MEVSEGCCSASGLRDAGFFEASPYFIVGRHGPVVGAAGLSRGPRRDHCRNDRCAKNLPTRVMDRRSLEEACADAGNPPGPSSVDDVRGMDGSLAMTCGVAGRSPSAAAVKGHSRRSEGAAKGRVAQKGVGSGSCWQVCPDDGRDHLVRQLRRHVFRTRIHEMFAGESTHGCSWRRGSRRRSSALTTRSVGVGVESSASLVCNQGRWSGSQPMLIRGRWS